MPSQRKSQAIEIVVIARAHNTLSRSIGHDPCDWLATGLAGVGSHALGIMATRREPLPTRMSRSRWFADEIEQDAPAGVSHRSFRRRQVGLQHEVLELPLRSNQELGPVDRPPVERRTEAIAVLDGQDRDPSRLQRYVHAPPERDEQIRQSRSGGPSSLRLPSVQVLGHVVHDGFSPQTHEVMLALLDHSESSERWSTSGAATRGALAPSGFCPSERSLDPDAPFPQSPYGRTWPPEFRDRPPAHQVCFRACDLAFF
jgi:hypothetical protein